MGAKKDEAIANIAPYGVVEATSTLFDSRANPYNVIDPNGYGWWGPHSEIDLADLTISFDRPYFVEKIIIRWHLKPPRYELKFKNAHGIWGILRDEEPQGDIELEITPFQLTAINISIKNL